MFNWTVAVQLVFDWTVAVPLASDQSVIVHSVSDWSEIPDQCCRSTHQNSLPAQVVKEAEISSPDLGALNASLLLLSTVVCSTTYP